MALFDQPNQLVPGAPPNLPVVKPSAPPPPPPPPPPRIEAKPPQAKIAPALFAPEASPRMPSMPPAAPSRIPEPEDIFSGTGHGPNIPRTPETSASIAESPAKGLGRKLVRLLFLALGAAVVVTAGYFGWNYIMGTPQPAVTVTPVNENTNENANENANINIPVNENTNINIPVNENLNQNANLPPAIDMTTDTDKDGLSDYEETYIYHTDPLLADTDSDGLSDRDEIMVWKTDPLKPDTDGDGYKDGEEVKNGYNPLGPGKLPPPVVQ